MDNVSLHKILEEIDPVDAAKIHPNNRRRVLRSIQIYLESGESKTDLINKQEHAPIYENTHFLMAHFDRKELYELINKRVDLMIEKGLLNEVEYIYRNYPTSQAMQAIGYKEFIPYFKKEIELSLCIEQVKQDTRNYAKRQVTFFKNQFNVTTFNSIDEILENIKHG